MSYGRLKLEAQAKGSTFTKWKILHFLLVLAARKGRRVRHCPFWAHFTDSALHFEAFRRL